MAFEYWALVAERSSMRASPKTMYMSDAGLLSTSGVDTTKRI